MNLIGHGSWTLVMVHSTDLRCVIIIYVYQCVGAVGKISFKVPESIPSSSRIWTFLHYVCNTNESEFFLQPNLSAYRKQFYSLTRPTMATRHKFHTSFWQVFDRFLTGFWQVFDRLDGSHDKKPKNTERYPRWNVHWYIESDQQPSNLSETCQNLYKTYAGWPRLDAQDCNDTFASSTFLTTIALTATLNLPLFISSCC